LWCIFNQFFKPVKYFIFHLILLNYIVLFLFCQASIGASLEASIPSGETTLAHGSTFTVPAGITVLRASFNQSGYLNLITYVGVTPNKSYKLYSNWTEYNYGEGEEYLLYNANNNKYWIDYTIGNLDVDTGYTELNFKLEWSPTINSHAVEVTDY
jgi:hypothetical protein